MAAFVFTFFSLFVAKTTSSQEVCRSAKIHYSELLKNLEKLKQIDPVGQKEQYHNLLTLAEISIKEIKRLTPTFNISKEVVKISNYKKALENQEEKKSLSEDLELLMTSIEAMKKKHPANSDPVLEHLSSVVAEDAEYNLSFFKKRNPFYDCKAFETDIADYKKKWKL